MSGAMFSAFGLRPAAGRLFTDRDDSTPGAHPFAVLSFEYWSRRFSRDPRRHRTQGPHRQRSFRGHRNRARSIHRHGTRNVIDVFVPTMMNPYVSRSDASWYSRACLAQTGRPPRPAPGQAPCDDEVVQRTQSDRLDHPNQTVPGSFPRSNGAARTCAQRRLRHAAELPKLAHRPRRAGGAGAADRLRQRGQSDDRSGGREIPRDWRCVSRSARGAGGWSNWCWPRVSGWRRSPRRPARYSLPGPRRSSSANQPPRRAGPPRPCGRWRAFTFSARWRSPRRSCLRWRPLCARPRCGRPPL